MAGSYVPLPSGEEPVTALVSAINAALINISAAVLLYSGKEEPTEPLRVWIYGYIMLCLFEVVLSCMVSLFGNRPDLSSCSFTVLSIVYMIAVLVWWALGVYWLQTGGRLLLSQAPLLFWYSLVLVALPSITVIFGLCCACCIDQKQSATST